jgi:monothiol glutaredoxin
MAAMTRIRTLVESHPVVLFMKGTPEFPMCGYSARAAEVLGKCDTPFHAVNVLADPEIRASLPRYSNWPTFPQLFIHGELIGGCDIVVELFEQGQLQQMVADAAAA